MTRARLEPAVAHGYDRCLMTNVLIVDDNEDIRFLVDRVLGLEGFRVVQAAGGAEALSLLASGTEVHIVVLDVQMHEMDGWDTLRAIRQDPRTADLPVVLCTVRGSTVDMVRGWELGCDGYVSKPFSVRPFVAQLRHLLALTLEERRALREERLGEARPERA